ncbi:copper homeostasis protein CutC [Thorsellia anophelis]|uniref:PF03932 family protein CutC n=1 Tax=Thorsellia anophelis DSM 18579 TaxID=1123402 RepID=A0A1I0B409_9GAMM|nr:copper homeostasis protein CutC [Thorsellia anophelis]SET01608.1 copper homeostasis protein [Thorsellia anophelis DSM 18579]
MDADTRSVIKEACVDGYTQAIQAWKKGADRIELCADLTVGGVTPSMGTIAQTIKDVPLPIFVLIRPRGGNFHFSEAEFKIMLQDITLCKTLGVAGVVIGALDKNNQIDSRINTLIDCAKPMAITFHKAFDEIDDKLAAIDKITQLGCDRILSSASGISIYDHIEHFESLIQYAKNKITFVACGGVSDKNLKDVSNQLSTNEFHGKLIVGQLGKESGNE